MVDLKSRADCIHEVDVDQTPDVEGSKCEIFAEKFMPLIDNTQLHQEMTFGKLIQLQEEFKHGFTQSEVVERIESHHVAVNGLISLHFIELFDLLQRDAEAICHVVLEQMKVMQKHSNVEHKLDLEWIRKKFNLQLKNNRKATAREVKSNSTMHKHLTEQLVSKIEANHRKEIEKLIVKNSVEVDSLKNVIETSDVKRSCLESSYELMSQKYKECESELAIYKKDVKIVQEMKKTGGIKLDLYTLSLKEKIETYEKDSERLRGRIDDLIKKKKCLEASNYQQEKVLGKLNKEVKTVKNLLRESHKELISLQKENKGLNVKVCELEESSYIMNETIESLKIKQYEYEEDKCLFAENIELLTEKISQLKTNEDKCRNDLTETVNRMHATISKLQSSFEKNKTYIDLESPQSSCNKIKKVEEISDNAKQNECTYNIVKMDNNMEPLPLNFDKEIEELRSQQLFLIKKEMEIRFRLDLSKKIERELYAKIKSILIRNFQDKLNTRLVYERFRVNLALKRELNKVTSKLTPNARKWKFGEINNALSVVYDTLGVATWDGENLMHFQAKCKEQEALLRNQEEHIQVLEVGIQEKGSFIETLKVAMREKDLLLVELTKRCRLQSEKTHLEATHVNNGRPHMIKCLTMHNLDKSNSQSDSHKPFASSSKSIHSPRDSRAKSVIHQSKRTSLRPMSASEINSVEKRRMSRKDLVRPPTAPVQKDHIRTIMKRNLEDEYMPESNIKEIKSTSNSNQNAIFGETAMRYMSARRNTKF